MVLRMDPMRKMEMVTLLMVIMVMTMMALVPMIPVRLTQVLILMLTPVWLMMEQIMVMRQKQMR